MNSKPCYTDKYDLIISLFLAARQSKPQITNNPRALFSEEEIEGYSTKKAVVKLEILPLINQTY